MSYVMYENGRIRYYPDDEFHKEVESTLSKLNPPENKSFLNMFNSALDELYKNPGNEKPIRETFDCMETYLLSKLKNNKYNRLNKESIADLMHIYKAQLGISGYSDHDEKVYQKIDCIFEGWVKICNNYRHGKKHQISKEVPVELVHFIFSTGISIFRLLLELEVYGKEDKENS